MSDSNSAYQTQMLALMTELVTGINSIATQLSIANSRGAVEIKGIVTTKIQP